MKKLITYYFKRIITIIDCSVDTVRIVSASAFNKDENLYVHMYTLFQMFDKHQMLNLSYFVQQFLRT